MSSPLIFVHLNSKGALVIIIDFIFEKDELMLWIELGCFSICMLKP